jgi:hypothetical protein
MPTVNDLTLGVLMRSGVIAAACTSGRAFQAVRMRVSGAGMGSNITKASARSTAAPNTPSQNPPR